MRSKKLSFTIEVETEVSCSFSPGYPGRGPSMDNAGGEPPEPAEISDLYVGVIVGGEAIDITALLTPKQMERFEHECIEHAEELAFGEADAS